MADGDGQTVARGRTMPGVHQTTVQPKDKSDPAMKIFVIEESKPQAKYMAAQLGHFGFDVAIFAKPADAVQAMAEDPAQVILTDVSADGRTSGIKAIATLKQAGGGTPPHVIALSTHTDWDCRLMAVQTGADGYYVKPINVPHLVEHIDRLTSAPREIVISAMVVTGTETPGDVAGLLKGAGMNTISVTRPDAVPDAVSEHKPDVLVIDDALDGCSGIDLVQVIRQMDMGAAAPVMFLAGPEGASGPGADAVRAGGDEVLPRDVSPDWLLSVVRARGTRGRDLARWIQRDGMTGLYTHTGIRENLARELAQAKRRKAQLSFAVVDVDGLSQVNETYGYAVGDRVILSLARVLSQHIRASDILGRFGGEQFAVILPDCPRMDALKVMDGIRTRYEKVVQTAPGGKSFYAAFSCGIATFPLADNATRLVDGATQALHRAKDQGRNRAVAA